MTSSPPLSVIKEEILKEKKKPYGVLSDCLRCVTSCATPLNSCITWWLTSIIYELCFVLHKIRLYEHVIMRDLCISSCFFRVSLLFPLYRL